MKKLFLFILLLACFCCFAESRQEKRNRILSEMSEEPEYKEAKQEFVNSEEVKHIVGFKFEPKSIFKGNTKEKFVCFENNANTVLSVKVDNKLVWKWSNKTLYGDK